VLYLVRFVQLNISNY